MMKMSYVKYALCMLEPNCRKFAKRFISVKIQLFKSYCLRLYGTALWRC